MFPKLSDMFDQIISFLQLNTTLKELEENYISKNPNGMNVQESFRQPHFLVNYKRDDHQNLRKPLDFRKSLLKKDSERQQQSMLKT